MNLLGPLLLALLWLLRVQWQVVRYRWRVSRRLRALLDLS